MFRGKCSMLFHYDWISVPLVYTQVSPSVPPFISSVRRTGFKGKLRVN